MILSPLFCIHGKWANIYGRSVDRRQMHTCSMPALDMGASNYLPFTRRRCMGRDSRRCKFEGQTDLESDENVGYGDVLHHK